MKYEGVTYYYKIRPVDAKGNVGKFSAVVEMPYLDTEVKIETSNREKDGYPVLKWNKVPGAVKYQLYRSTTGKDGSFNLLITTKDQQIVNTSAKAGQTYFYKVRAVSSDNVRTEFSNVVRNGIVLE